MVLAVQRKVFDGFSYVKLKDRIRYPNKLNLKKYFLYPSINSTEYELKSVIIHHGNADTGHYLTVRKTEVPMMTTTTTSSDDKCCQTQWILASDDKVIHYTYIFIFYYYYRYIQYLKMLHLVWNVVCCFMKEFHLLINE